jgi:transcriptional regulator with XRE-family HTH domain
VKVSPYVCRLRLAEDVLDARRQAGLTTEQLSNRSGVQRQKISHIETAKRRVEPGAVKDLLEHLSVDEARYATMMRLAEDAADRGWWERYDDEMGPRQARAADLEKGAAAIFQYNPFLFPGLLQTPKFATVRAEAERAANPRRFSTARMLEARAQRRAILSGPEATRLEVILDEGVLRRRSAPAEVMHEQLEHLAGAALNHRSVTVRVLPFATELNLHKQARTAFSRYTYADPDDPIVVMVDTNVEDRLIHDHDEGGRGKVAIYSDLVSELRRVALGPADSIEWLSAAAEACLSRR